MFPSMECQCTFLHIGPSTYIALIEPFARVNQDMLLQTILPEKGIIADRTCKQLETLVNSHVEVEIAFRSECLPTSETRELLLHVP